ncbi:lytic transglycosylase domain-containing protein [bacterium]|nr:lytic transglycosylase domain-containing protein [bacterium]
MKSITYNPVGKVKKKNYITISGQTTYLVGPTLEDDWDSLIKKISTKYQLDPYLVKAVIKVESNFDPYSISHKGASGLMQLMPKTAVYCGVRDIFDPEENIEGGIKYLSYLWDIFEADLKLVLAGYNAGPNKVRKYKGIPPYRETRNYVKKVLFYYDRYKSE